LKVHSGAVELSSLSSRHPAEIMFDIKKTILRLGMEIKSDSDFKIKCVRRKRKTSPNNNVTNNGDAVASHSIAISGEPLYGEDSIDSGEEIRFSIELCRIKNLHGLYSVDIRRMKGNLWAYKFLY
ncbi:hypothetical protein BCR41DRAFT_292697, partial [Lobosporangium transversale]